MTQRPGESAIVAEGLVKRFGDVTALDGVDLDVPEGTVFGLLGPNGAGKTTAVRILTTLLQPDERAAPTSAASTSRKHPDAVRRSIGLTGQYAAVDEYLTGRENLEMVGRLYHLPSRAREARAPTSCSSASTSPTPPTGPPRPTPAACAAGSTSRPAWSRGRRCSSSTSRPPASTRGAAATCGTSSSDLVADGTTVLLTTQYLEEADQLADDIVVIDHGRVIADGTADELKDAGRRRPRRGRRRATARARRRGGGARARSPSARADVDDATPQRHRRRSRAAPARCSRPCARSTPRASSVDDIALRRPTLDDVFLSLTGHAAEEDAAGADAAEAARRGPKEDRMSAATVTADRPPRRPARRPR